MRKKIQNSLAILCDDVDLNKVSDIEFYVRQGRFFRQYTPQIVSDHEMLVQIPLADAKQLTLTTARLQFAFVDENGNPRATEIEEVPVGDLLKEAGYDPV